MEMEMQLGRLECERQHACVIAGRQGQDVSRLTRGKLCRSCVGN